MKKLLLSGIVAAILPLSALADARYQGEFFITALSSKCAQNGWKVGDYGRVRYRPANIDGNDSSTRFAIHHSRYAQAYRIRNGSLQTFYQDVEAGGLASSIFTWNGASMRYKSMRPAAPNANTRNITMVVQIRTFDEVPGCTATLSGALTKRP